MQLIPSAETFSSPAGSRDFSSQLQFEQRASVRDITPISPAAAHERLSTIQRLVRNRLQQWMSTMSWGQIEFLDAYSHAAHMNRSMDQDSPSCTWIVKSPELYSRIAVSGAMGLAESYIRGDWATDDLTSLLRILYRQFECQNQFRISLADFALRIGRLMEGLLGNSIARSRKQIAAHYDLSNEFFELFLDSSLMYSSAYFERPDMTLEEASKAKLNQICSKLQLRDGDELLEIGTGWGGCALHIANHHDVQITTTTISDKQYSKAAERFAAAECGDRIQLLRQDYRKLNGTYDKLISIEMIEAVGEKNLDIYFRKCGELLRPGGRIVIQAIVMPEQRYDSYRRSKDFIQKYIFPGGFLPSISAIQQSVGRTTDFRLTHVDDLTPHYARTLLEWRMRFIKSLEEVRNLRFDEQFIRMWEYYLCYCEAAFREQAVRVVQIAWDRPNR
ncbi:MAG: class I SAM-dependent methyltransferase [Planctomycetales bacterium]|nr:class I SAM-dependent methyltransferase [Planctomycetales bacterium]